MVLFILFFALDLSHAFNLNDLDLEKVASGGKKLLSAAAGLSDDDEVKVGRDVAANLAARYGLVEDPVKVKYINLVGQAVVQKCPRNDLDYHFGILKTPEINALAAPGGYIFITEGLLNTLQNEAELAGVLAHEVSHVTQKHIVKAIRKSNLIGAGEDLAAAADKGVQKYAQLSDFSVNMLENGLSRGDELEADRLGTALAAKVGYNPLGLREAVTRLGGKGDTSALAHFNKTHPPTAERIEAIDKTLAAGHLSNKGPNLADRFRKNIKA